MPEHRQITYTDELLADGSVHRRYADGRQEWRTRGAQGVVSWRDDRGNSGTDEGLGPKIVKRTYRNGSVVYGREAGFGRTLWGDGALTVNRSSFGGRLGGILAAVAGGALLGALVMPPSAMSAEEEEELRRQAAAQSSGSSDGGGDYGGWDDDGGDDGGDFG
ncbi:hypothetical protein [Nocardia pseudovaccinii]|uniref:hypothetical protein n=1 Tax=Nocardia pseudovaccinii TaxID=189540 RepID=UPI0007A50308|nr:hypothetical protein [Nocardia pseudovaccinii]